MIVHQSGHLATMNSKALEIGGIGAETPNPAGGVIQRRAGGKEPNGVLEETAFFPVLMKLLGRLGPDASKEFIRAGCELWARFGYTTAQDGRSSPGVVKAMQTVAAAGGLPIDVVSYPDVLMDRELIFVILDKNPLAVDVEQLDQLKVVETVKEGVTVFALSGAKRTGAMMRRGNGTEVAIAKTLRAVSGHPGLGAQGPCGGCVCGSMTRLAEVIAGGKVE